MPAETESSGSAMSKAYDPAAVERRLYQMWEDGGYFSPSEESEEKERKPFSIIMPPPNLTGELHLGHALNGTLQDILVIF